MKYIKRIIFSIASLIVFFNKTLANVANNINTTKINLLDSGNITTIFVAKFALFIAIILFTTLLSGKILKVLFKIPIIAGQIVGGIILSPSLIDIKKISFFNEPLNILDSTKNQLFSIASSELFFFFVILLSSTFTVSYLLWLAGHETDVKDVVKVGIQSTLAGVFGVIIPIFLTTITVSYFWGSSYSLISSIGLGIAFAATSVSIPVAMLIAQNRMNLRFSKATMGASVVDDILAVILFSVFIILMQSGTFGKSSLTKVVGSNIHCTSIYNAIINILLTFIVFYFLGKFLIIPSTETLKKYKLSHIIPSFATIAMLIYFSISELLGGLAGITGAYFAGLFHRIGDHKHNAVRATSPFVNTILLPLFLGSVGMQVDVSILNCSDWAIAITLLFIAIISKILGCYLTIFFSNIFTKNKKWTLLEGYLFGSAMVARGEVGLVLATILKGTNLFTPNQYVICVLVIVLSTIVAPIMLAIGFKKLDKEKTGEFSLLIKPFKFLSNRYIFDILCAQLESDKKLNPIFSFSENKKMVTIENTKIILDPENGLLLKGDENKIKKILGKLKTVLIQDIETIPSPIAED